MTDDALIKLSIVGDGVADFLQGYVTCDLEEMSDSYAIPMALTQLQGRVIANGWLFGTHRQITLVVHASLQETVQNHLAPYMRFAGCTFEQNPVHVFLTKQATNSSNFVSIKNFEHQLSENESDKININDFQMITGYAITNEQSSGLFLPQMLNLTDFDAVSFDKGCYLGQEVVARAQHRGQVKRQLSKFSHNSATLHVGGEVRTEGGVKGTVLAFSDHEALVVSSAQSDDTVLV